jgi:hypothetical protein
MLLVLTIAVKSPAVVGEVESVTVSDVAVASVTVPTAPLSNTSVLFPAVVSKPYPAIVIVVALAGRLAVLLVMTGMTVAICTAAPLLILPVVMTAVKLPAMVGNTDNDTVRDVFVADVTVPTAPFVKVTVLLPAVESKPTPTISTLVALAASK